VYEIKRKDILAPNIKLFDVYAPLIAAKAKAGQFIILRQHEKAERIPLTIADYDRKNGLITIIFQEIGRSTFDLGKLETGDFILDFVGPLGCESDIDNYGTVVCIGGGVGVAPLFPVARALKEKENRIVSIIGARNSESLIWENKMRNVSDLLYVTTDDGSYGEKGFVTDILTRVVEKEQVNMVMAIGPLGMMQNVAELTRKQNIKTLVSLNPIMLDGTGMCGACRIQVGSETKFACVDGPEFDGHQVDWETAKSRAKMFVTEEKIAMQGACKGHCSCGGEC